ncbi:MAG TPA: IPT/TIG domain-containing protein [Mycobacteriales bacterium]|nr:IPT/TIG domain-containing protein [Mycobacteriales bacterium]
MTALPTVRRGAATAVALVAASAGVLATPSQAATSPVAPVPPAVSTMIPNSGPLVGGTTVRIDGTGFTGATSVRFGKQTPAMSFTVMSDGRIVAVSPRHAAGRVIVTVTTPNGTSTAEGLENGKIAFVFSPYAPTVSQPAGELLRYQLGTGARNKITMTVAKSGETSIVDTEKPATYRFELPAPTMRKLRELAANAHVSTLDARYPRPDEEIACGTDTQILTVRGHKIVVGYAGEPPARAQRLLDRLLAILDNRDPAPFAVGGQAARSHLRC